MVDLVKLRSETQDYKVLLNGELEWGSREGREALLFSFDGTCAIRHGGGVHEESFALKRYVEARGALTETTTCSGGPFGRRLLGDIAGIVSGHVARIHAWHQRAVRRPAGGGGVATCEALDYLLDELSKRSFRADLPVQISQRIPLQVFQCLNPINVLTDPTIP